MPEEKQSIFKTLSAINLSEKHKEKGGLIYLPWASAWAAVKAIYPDARFDIINDENGINYHTDGRTCWVETSVTIEDQTQRETLAIMDNRNAPIPYDKVTSVNVGKSLKRCLTKNLGLFGLDLNLWIGEELSDDAKAIKEEEEKKKQQAEKEKQAALKKVKDEVVAAGSKLMNNGVPKEKIMEIVGKHNNGNQNPSSISSEEVCAAVMKEFEPMLKNIPADGTGTKPTTKTTQRKAKETT